VTIGTANATGVIRNDDLPATPQPLFSLPVSADATLWVIGDPENNVLNGSAANDFIDSWGGDDTMAGGAGDDTYCIWTSKCVINESAGNGIDTVLDGAPTYTLADGVENLVVYGRMAQTATGNALNNLMTSNDYGSTMNGGAGNDCLVAGKGADSLTGGTGNDEFVFNSLPTAAGHITDFTAGADCLDLRGIFASIGYHGSDPIADHYLSFTDNGAGGVALYVDKDGTGAAAATLVTTLDNLSSSTLKINVNVWFV
jgi:Ca2+-binding RTX toxin-like protein